ncbi:unnamed protein product, partial [Brassica oleracea var. botrytis]
HISLSPSSVSLSLFLTLFPFPEQRPSLCIMTHPHEEMREMEELKNHYDMIGFIADAQYGIPTRCPCGGEIMKDASPNPKYPSDFDTLPGRRYLSCKRYKDDGMHFRQP